MPSPSASHLAAHIYSRHLCLIPYVYPPFPLMFDILPPMRRLAACARRLTSTAYHTRTWSSRWRTCAHIRIRTDSGSLRLIAYNLFLWESCYQSGFEVASPIFKPGNFSSGVLSRKRNLIFWWSWVLYCLLFSNHLGLFWKVALLLFT
jgi:hypothetical protein